MNLFSKIEFLTRLVYSYHLLYYYKPQKLNKKFGLKEMLFVIKLC